MLLVRELFTAKPGQAGKLAKLFKKGFGHNPKIRIMTDIVASYNAVVVEMELKDLAEFDKMMEDHRSGKPDPRMNPEIAEEMSTYTDMYLTGRREIFRIE